ncbi:MAG: MotA/TolQ/ExbB proton channel family protein [Proteobacteria bacterium]|nr:MotA/TolQ/ExbB proton channel family protein [Pseudomonadota bacterium]
MDQIYYYLPALESVRDFFELGGNVLYLIAATTFIMWGLIIERLIFINGQHLKNYKLAVGLWSDRKDHHSRYAHYTRARLVSNVSMGLSRNIDLIHTCVILCPLMGLLGTVSGMIEVFQVMGFSGAGNARSMAGGIFKATIPTMAGMVAALSGIAMTTYLQRKTANEKHYLREALHIH